MSSQTSTEKGYLRTGEHHGTHGWQKGHTPKLTQAEAELAENRAGPGPTVFSPVSSLQSATWSGHSVPGVLLKP